MWTLPLDVSLDVTTRCNAGCPQCHRTDPMGLNKASWLPDIHWTIEDFKKALPPEIMKDIYNFDFCGTWGDCLTNQDILPMVKYLRKNSPEASICINTNGSLRNEQFWWDLGVAGGKKLQVAFCVEGTTQEMHENYRQFTFLDKILANMDMLSNTPAKIRSQTLVWKHNEHCLPEIEKLCMDHGSMRHHFVATDRWNSSNTKELKFTVKDKPGILEATSPDWQKTFRQTHQERKEDENRPDYTRIDRRRFTTQKAKVGDGEKKLMKKLEDTSQGKIVCEWGTRNKVVINPDGQVLPCCYFCNPHFFNKNVPKIRKRFIDHPIMKEYKIYEKELNVFTANLMDIINHKWFREILPESWNSPTPVAQCSRYCSKYTL
jgi:MoaA/NifB/PqqE/SkfB family radical SAM enzyme